MKAIDYTPILIKRLKDPNYAAGLLKYSLKESLRDGNWAAFGLLLQDVIQAQGDNTQAFAKKAGVSRPHLYRMFGKKANPTLETFSAIIDALGLELSISPKTKRRNKVSTNSRRKKAA